MKSRERRQWWVRTPNTEHRGRDANRQPVTRELKHKESGKRGSTTATAAKAIIKKKERCVDVATSRKDLQAHTETSKYTENNEHGKPAGPEAAMVRRVFACLRVCREREGITEKSYTSLS